MDQSQKGMAKSKRLYAAIAAVIVVLFQDHLGLSLDPDQVQALIVVVVGLILGDSCRGVGVKATPDTPPEPKGPVIP